MQDAVTITCARHPDVETELRCGRCETPICPRCIVYTPGGTRCPDCAQLRRPPMYELAPSHYLRAALVAIVLAAPLGYLGALLLPPRASIGIFALVLGAAAGWGAGSLVGEALTRATGGKRGTALMIAASACILGAAIVRVFVSGAPWELAVRDFTGLMMVLVALSTVTGRLR